MDNTTTDTQSRPNPSTEHGEKGIAPNSGTQTQPSPNISTEHPQERDARSPSDTLDRGQESEGGLPVTDVEDRPMVGSVTPNDYPKDLPDH